MEELFNPWNINAQTNPQSKEFLGNIMNGVRRNFKENLELQNPAYKAFKYTNPAHPTTYKTDRTPAYNTMQQDNPAELAKIRSNYPDVYQAFKDRKAQFKNPLVGQMTPQMGAQANTIPSNNTTTTTTTLPLAAQISPPPIYMPPFNNTMTTTTTMPFGSNTP